MRRRFLSLWPAVLLWTLAGCMVAPVVPPMGAVYTGYQAPLDLDYLQTKLGTKRGESSCISVLGLVSVGDASTSKAAENGDIKTIQTADYSYTNVFFGVFQRYTTIVYGD